jgi:copper(I)-binding protein
MRRFLVAACLQFALTAGVEAKGEAITIDRATAKPAAANAVSDVVYLRIIDKTGSDRLLAAQTPVAGGAAFHRSGSQLGVMRVGEVKGIDVDRNVPLVLGDTGYSLVLTGLTQPLLAGDSFPLTLVFETAGVVTTNVTVTP